MSRKLKIFQLDDCHLDSSKSSWSKISDTTYKFIGSGHSEYGYEEDFSKLKALVDAKKLAPCDIYPFRMPNNNMVWYYSISGNEDSVSALPCGMYILKEDYSGSYALKMTVQEKFATALTDHSNIIKSEINTFIKSKSRCAKLKIPHRRGILLYGQPGTGKTSLIRRICSELSKTQECLIFFLDSVPDSEFLSSIKDDPRLKVFIIEELLALAEKCLVSLLKFLDGELTPDHCLVLATSNYPEELPAPLADRSCRFDVLLQIDSLSERDRLAVLQHLLPKAQITDAVLRSIEDFTLADIKELGAGSLQYQIPIEEMVNRIVTRKEVVKKHFKKTEGRIGFS